MPSEVFGVLVVFSGDEREKLRPVSEPATVPRPPRAGVPPAPGLHRVREARTAPGEVVGAARLVHEIALAIKNAAVAASPPIKTVWKELRTGDAPVKWPFTYPKIARASSVIPTDAGRAVPAFRAM